MDQVKIGKFISECRKANGWTQIQLAVKLGVTDKAVSKWETGRSIPDVSLLMPLCKILKCSLNELLLGEAISSDDLVEKSNELLMGIITKWLGEDRWNLYQDIDQSEIILRLHEVQKDYVTATTSTTAVSQVSFQLSQGSFVGIMGASGSGKTTLLNMIATIDKPTHGIIEINGQDITIIADEDLAGFRRDHLGFIFQDYNLLETLNVYENIALPLIIKGIETKNIKKIITSVAEKLEITNILFNFPYEISGGQRQRCACARAIVAKPSLILADEPTGALDSHSAKQLLDALLMLREEYTATILMVTHDAMSASYCDKILFMQDGEIKDMLNRGEYTKQEFFVAILQTMAQIGGEGHYVS
jgi:putative ABC transport system ATP-binding protein